MIAEIFTKLCLWHTTFVFSNTEGKNIDNTKKVFNKDKVAWEWKSIDEMFYDARPFIEIEEHQTSLNMMQNELEDLYKSMNKLFSKSEADELVKEIKSKYQDIINE